MGGYWTLSIGSEQFEEGKNYLPGYAVHPFQDGDYEAMEGRLGDDGDELEPSYVYRALAGTVARRLDILGYTVPSARLRYDDGLNELDDFDREHWPTEWLGPSGFDRWMRGDQIDPGPDSGRSIALEQHFHGFPHGDPLLVLRCLLARYGPATPVTLDISDLALEGYVSERLDAGDFVGRAPSIVLTEGKSDARILRTSVEVLFPEYREFLKFIDYETANARGGTSELVQFVRMIVGCGIMNRIVVLFDNDAAGHDALARLGNDLPPTVFPMCLPTMAFFERYPTVGPDGATVSSIDGRGCSLELYLGVDALTDPASRELRPVRWGGFIETIGRYQGEVSAKRRVQEHFEEILEEVRRDPNKRRSFDFSGVEAIFEAVFSALAGR